jgi:hypothetical protein
MEVTMVHVAKRNQRRKRSTLKVTSSMQNK